MAAKSMKAIGRDAGLATSGCTRRLHEPFRRNAPGTTMQMLQHIHSVRSRRSCCRSVVRGAGLATAFIAAATPALGCSECGCSLSSDWAAQGYQSLPGLQTGVRFEYYNQSVLRSGTGSVDRSLLPLPNEDEIQQRTLNRNVWLGADYVFDGHWGLGVQLPYYDRSHSTIAPGDTEISTSHARGLGDLQIVGRYQRHGLRQNWGLQVGLKLPTGRTDQDFAAGPQAGEPLDRGLQLGAGTVNLLAGASWFTRPAPTVGCFAQVLLDQPLNARASFRPSPSLSFNCGARYLNASALTPQVQLNVRWDGRESGANADRGNSGDTLAYLSPGVSADLGRRSQAFVFLQLPVYQRVNGLQITPRWLLTLGLRFEL
jgi:hypothetical protein